MIEIMEIMLSSHCRRATRVQFTTLRSTLHAALQRVHGETPAETTGTTSCEKQALKT